jgi:hypothetical protein
LSLLLALPAHSASVSYILNQSNALADGVDYLKVTLSDGAAGAINFKIEVLSALQDLACGNFGIQSFAFNIVGGTDTQARNVTGLPRGWRAGNGGRMDGFGQFDLVVKGTGYSRTDALEFSITGVSLDSLMSYVDPSTGSASQGRVFFAAHVAGFSSNSSPTIESFGLNSNHSGKSQFGGFNGGCGAGGGHDGHHGGGDDGGKCDGSAYFGGPGTPVPVPPAVLLFGSGLGIMASVRRRSLTAVAS